MQYLKKDALTCGKIHSLPIDDILIGKNVISNVTGRKYMIVSTASSMGC